ncbi:4Fe-4S binding protein [bacterium]|nr:4Fe-4S binding protein [bacterium]
MSGIGNWGEGVAKLGWSLLCGGMTFGMLCSGKFYNYRFLLFFLLAVGALIAFHLTPLSQIVEWSDKTGPDLDSQIAFCHISIVSILGNTLENLFSSLVHGPWSHWGVYYLPGLLYLLFTLLLGTAWCSWACFYGAWDESAARLAGKKPWWRLSKSPGKWRHIGLGVLLAVIVLAFISREAFFCRWICPFKLTTQFWDATGIYRWLQILVMLLAGIGFVFVLSWLTGKRMFCSYLCPFGAWQSIVGRISPISVKCRHTLCNRCGQCQTACPMHAISVSQTEAVKISEYCNRCGRCLEICPQQAMQLVWKHQETEVSPNTAWTSIVFVLCAVIVHGMLGIAIWGSIGKQLIASVLNG